MRGGVKIAIRAAVGDDLVEVLAIYNEVIAFSTAVFSEQTVTLEDRERWLAARQGQGYPVLVACDSTGVNCRAIATDPTILSNVQDEQAKLNKDMAAFKFYPVISIGFGVKF